MTDEVVMSISDRYIELFEKVTGKEFVKDHQPLTARIKANIIKSI